VEALEVVDQEVLKALLFEKLEVSSSDMPVEVLLTEG
jgi:hypothetical protein